MKNWPAHRLRVLALRWLRQQYPDALLTFELAVAKYGDASLDVAAITETNILGVEIKGDGDSHARLERQGWVYSRSATRMWLLAAPSHSEKIEKHKPPGWGVLRVEDDSLKPLPWARASLLPNAPAALADILWKKELITVGQRLGIRVTSRQDVETIATAISEQVALAKLRPLVCQALIERDWSGMKPNGKKVWRPGDDLPDLPAIAEAA